MDFLAGSRQRPELQYQFEVQRNFVHWMTKSKFVWVNESIPFYFKLAVAWVTQIYLLTTKSAWLLYDRYLMKKED